MARDADYDRLQAPLDVSFFLQVCSHQGHGFDAAHDRHIEIGKYYGVSMVLLVGTLQLFEGFVSGYAVVHAILGVDPIIEKQ